MAAPHDRYFTYAVDRPENAVGLLRPILPAGLSQRVDWDSLVSERSTSVQYISEVGNRATGAVLRQVLHSVLTEAQTEELTLPILRQARKEGEAKGRAKGRAEGEAKERAEGKAESLLKLLAARGIPVNATARRRIQRCTDVALLDRWFDRALSARGLSDVLDEPRTPRA